MAASLPPRGTLLQDVRTSCARVTEASGIRISEEAVDAFLASLDRGAFAEHAAQHGLAFPLRFDTFAEEVNFIAVLSLLNALSGYRNDFHQATGHGVFDSIRRLLLGLYLTPADDGVPPLSAKGLQGVRAASLAQILGVSTHTESQHPTLPFVTVGTVGGPLQEPLELLATMCNDAGKFLDAHGKKDLGTYVLDAFADALAAAPEHIDSVLLGAIAQVPGFNDSTTVDFTPAYVMKKALYLVHALREKVAQSPAGELPSAAAQMGAHWQSKDAAALPMFIDNVIPTMLLYQRVLDMSSSDVSALHAWSPDASAPVLSGADAYRVRAGALTAGAQIVARAHACAKTDEARAWLASLTEVGLDGYLWSSAKEPALRAIPRLAERGTGMY
ncbi:hypothetical protein MSPP1_000095 [Malassezia sp. CBS 17886]|nr:hypothetical protein MSPP1_000095 [Malassezia sp. CBS 17886]